MFDEKLKIPNFFELKSSQRYTESTSFSYENGQGKGESYRNYYVDENGERIQEEKTVEKAF